MKNVCYTDLYIELVLTMSVELVSTTCALVHANSASVISEPRHIYMPCRNKFDVVVSAATVVHDDHLVCAKRGNGLLRCLEFVVSRRVSIVIRQE